MKEQELVLYLGYQFQILSKSNFLFEMGDACRDFEEDTRESKGKRIDCH